jgi:hypothetical protein
MQQMTLRLVEYTYISCKGRCEHRSNVVALSVRYIDALCPSDQFAVVDSLLSKQYYRRQAGGQW